MHEIDYHETHTRRSCVRSFVSQWGHLDVCLMRLCGYVSKRRKLGRCIYGSFVAQLPPPLGPHFTALPVELALSPVKIPSYILPIPVIWKLDVNCLDFADPLRTF